MNITELLGLVAMVMAFTNVSLQAQQVSGVYHSANGDRLSGFRPAGSYVGQGSARNLAEQAKCQGQQTL